MTDIADLRLDAEADRRVCSVQAGEDEHDRSVHRLIWYPRFGLAESVPPDSAEPVPTGEHDGQGERNTARR